jgi:ABC-type lipoprotein export system ATPase subunit
MSAEQRVSAEQPVPEQPVAAMQQVTTVLRADDLSHSVVLPTGDTLHLLSGISLIVESGESVAIQGRSGSGKSTLLAILGLLTTPTRGRLSLCGKDMTSASDATKSRMRNSSVGFVFQNYSLASHLTARQNVELALRYANPPRHVARRALVSDALGLVGLSGREQSYPRHLSGGEQQRVALARALVLTPSVVLADEPTGALDVDTGQRVVDVMLDAVESRGAALVVVTHDATVAGRMSRRLTLRDGQLHADRTE